MENGLQRDLKIANIGVAAALCELEEWAEEMGESYRREGFSAQIRKQEIIAATHIGREFAFQLMISRIREMREAIVTSRDPRD